MPKGNRRSYTRWTAEEIAFLNTVDPETGSLPTDDEVMARYPDRGKASISNRRAHDNLPTSGEIEMERRSKTFTTAAETPVEPDLPDDIADLIARIGDVGATPELMRAIFRNAHRMSEIAHTLSPTESQVRKVYDAMLPRAVAFSGDWHVGAAFVDTDLIDTHMAMIRDADGLDVIHMGDIVEGTTKDAKWIGSLMGVGSVGDRDLQDDMAVTLMETCRDKWLAVLDGNHDAMLMKMGATNHTATIARRLDVPYFREAGGTVFLTVGQIEYVIAVKHTYRGNSRLNTTNAQRVMFGDWPEWQNADVICLGHFHFNDMHKQTRKGGSCVYLRSGTYKTHDSYSQDQGYKPEWGIPVTVFLPDQRKVIPFRGDDFEYALRFLANERSRYMRGQVG